MGLALGNNKKAEICQKNLNLFEGVINALGSELLAVIDEKITHCSSYFLK